MHPEPFFSKPYNILDLNSLQNILKLTGKDEAGLGRKGHTVDPQCYAHLRRALSCGLSGARAGFQGLRRKKAEAL